MNNEGEQNHIKVNNGNKKSHIAPTISKFQKIWYFFPFQLFWLHLKRNQVILGLWLVLFLYAGRIIGNKYGIPYLFLSPEYLGDTDIVSYAILGMATGGFITAFNIYSYILFASEFPFLATFNRPFIKFCYNNIVIPLGFVLFYCWTAYRFQVREELLTELQAVTHIFGFLLGIFIFIILSSIYFIRFNKNIYHISGKDEAFFERKVKKSAKESTLHKETKWYYRTNLKRKKIKVVTYIHSFREIKLARSIKHYNKKLLRKVFAQNHINASVFEVMLFITFIVLGFFRDYALFAIPAGASIIIFFTLLLLFYSAIYSWLKKWTVSVILLLLFLFNYYTSSPDSYLFKSYAYGLDYTVKEDYSNEKLRELATNDSITQSDRKYTEQILVEWRKKYKEPPKMVVLNVSGGGLRSALWSYAVTAYLDSVCNNKLLEHTRLITGASGGMIGMAYLRELYWLKQTQDSSISLTSSCYTDNIAKDLLNPILFGIATTDFMFKFQKTEYKKHLYSKDRGYSFEEKIDENLDGIFSEKAINYYKIPEQEATIPMMLITPTVANDGRRLIISPHSHNYLANDTQVFGNINYQQFFKHNNPSQLRFLSALRMSANFPYILPLVSLPSQPAMEITDAGVKDNYGIQTSVALLSEFESWVKNNTSGIIWIEIRDTKKVKTIDKNESYNSLFERLFFPLGNLIKNILRIQDYNNSQLLETLKKEYSTEIDSFVLYVDSEEDNNVSMSWHLTRLDKKRILKAVHSKENQKSINKIKELLEH